LLKRKDELMPSNLPPEDQAKIKPFDRLVLDRTVIAVPLLKEMQEDLDLIAKVEEMYPTGVPEVQLRDRVQQEFRGGAKAHERKSSRWLRALNKKR
jgi:hypothetical protein